MKYFISYSTRNLVLSSKILILAVGLFLLTYVFYAGFFILPPHLNNLVIFSLIFIGLSAILYSTEGYLKVAVFFVLLGLCFLPLTWLWRGVEFDQFALMGIFPFNDGMQYLADAYRLLVGLDLTSLSTKRPIFVGLFAFLMWVFNGNLQTVLGLICAGTAISLYFLAIEIREIAGPIAAGLASTLLLYCYTPYLGRVYSENLGLNLGALGLVLLLKGARLKNLSILSMGAFTLSLALNVRAGAFFVLPALIVWGWAKQKIFGRKAPYILIGVISASFAINYLLVKTIGSQQGFLFSNFGATLYGLASGYKGWAYVLSIYPGIQEADIFPLALDLIRANPTALLSAILAAYKDYLTPGTMFQFLDLGNQHVWISNFLYILSMIGLYRLIKARDELHWSLILALIAGCFLSIAFVPPIDDGIRAMTATIPVNAFIAGFAFTVFPFDEQKSGNYGTYLPVTYSVFITILCVFGPLMVKAFNQTVTATPTFTCPEGTESISVMVSRGSYINIVKTGPQYGFIPYVRKKDIDARFMSYTPEDYPSILVEFQSLENLVKKFKPGETILIGLNQNELKIGNGPRQFIFLVTRTSQIQKIGNVNHFCARLATAARLRGNRFYYDVSVVPKE